MLDGLEAVELKFSEVLEDNETVRIDSEYFRKEILIAYNNLKEKSYYLNKDISLIKSGTTPKDRDDELKEGIILLKTNNVRNNILLDEKEKFYYIDNTTDEKMKSTRLKNGDVLINIVGATTDVIGRTSLIYDNFPKANITQAMAFCRIKPNILKEEYLFVFLQTYYGQIQVKRLARPTGQYNLNLEEVAKFIIPKLHNDFQSQIANLVKTSYQKLEKSKSLYKQAEELLLKELDLLDFKPSEENVAVKSFNESFGTTGRLDSEYYQPKYDELMNHIQKTKFDKLNNIVNIKKSIEPGSEAYQEDGIPFVRVSNVSKFDMSSPDIHLPKNMFDTETLKKLQPTEDTILLSKDGTVGIAYKIKNETNIITSGALLHLSIKKDKKDEVFPEYLTLVLNSLVVQLQAERDAGGSILQHWKPSEIGEVLIPIIDNAIQIKIEEKIKKSFELKEESKKLLDLAKRAVEVAIEKNEDEAIKAEK